MCRRQSFRLVLFRGGRNSKRKSPKAKEKELWVSTFLPILLKFGYQEELPWLYLLSRQVTSRLTAALTFLHVWRERKQVYYTQQQKANHVFLKHSSSCLIVQSISSSLCLLAESGFWSGGGDRRSQPQISQTYQVYTFFQYLRTYLQEELFETIRIQEPAFFVYKLVQILIWHFKIHENDSRLNMYLYLRIGHISEELINSYKTFSEQLVAQRKVFYTLQTEYFGLQFLRKSSPLHWAQKFTQFYRRRRHRFWRLLKNEVAVGLGRKSELELVFFLQNKLQRIISKRYNLFHASDYFW